MFEELLPKILRADFSVILSSPRHLELFLLAYRKVPSKLKSWMGSIDLFTDENMPRCERSGWWPLPGVLVPRPARPCSLIPLSPQTGECAEVGSYLGEEGEQAAQRGPGPAPPGS